MAINWQEAVGQSLTDHYVKSKGRNMAQSHFLMQMNARMQARNPGRPMADPREVEALRREIERLVVADVRRTHPDFSPERWTFWEPWEKHGRVSENGVEVDAVAFERNAGEGRVRYRRLPPPRVGVSTGEALPTWPLAECDIMDFVEPTDD